MRRRGCQRCRFIHVITADSRGAHHGGDGGECPERHHLAVIVAHAEFQDVLHIAAGFIHGGNVDLVDFVEFHKIIYVAATYE